MNISELIGAELDAAVAKSEGYDLDEDGDNRTVRESGGAPSAWHPSTDWSIGGPIIQRERIAVYPRENILTDGLAFQLDAWVACLGFGVGLEGFTGEESAIVTYSVIGYGPTPLIAAMRAYCASKG